MDTVWVLSYHDVESNMSGIVSAFNDEEMCKREAERLTRFGKKSIIFATHEVEVE